MILLSWRNTWNYRGPAAVGKNIRYVYDSILGGGGLPILSPSRVHAVLSLSMYLQQHQFQVLTTVRALHPYPLYGPVYYSLPCHPPLVICV